MLSRSSKPAPQPSLSGTTSSAASLMASGAQQSGAPALPHPTGSLQARGPGLPQSRWRCLCSLRRLSHTIPRSRQRRARAPRAKWNCSCAATSPVRKSPMQARSQVPRRARRCGRRCCSSVRPASQSTLAACRFSRARCRRALFVMPAVLTPIASLCKSLWACVCVRRLTLKRCTE